MYVADVAYISLLLCKNIFLYRKIWINTRQNEICTAGKSVNFNFSGMFLVVLQIGQVNAPAFYRFHGCIKLPCFFIIPSVNTFYYFPACFYHTQVKGFYVLVLNQAAEGLQRQIHFFCFNIQ